MSRKFSPPAAALAALLLAGGAPLCAAPYMLLDSADFKGSEIVLSGSAWGGEGAHEAAWAFSARGRTPAEKDYQPLPCGAAGGRCAFSLKTAAAGGDLVLRSRDAKGNESFLKLYLTVREDYKGLLTYLSPSALDTSALRAGSFTVYAGPGVREEAPAKAAAKLERLRAHAEKTLGLDRYERFGVLLYGSAPSDKATFSAFRGFIGDERFAFPLAASSLRGDALHSVLDSWAVHELGDHSVRALSPGNGDAIRWLAEGSGDYLRYSYLKSHYPDFAEAYTGRLQLKRMVSKKVNLDGDKWGPDYYLASAALVYDLEARRPGILYELFTAVVKLPAAERSEPAVRKELSRLLGKDITPLLKDFPLDEAVKVLCGAALKSGNAPQDCPKKPRETWLKFFGKPAKK